MTRLSDIFPLSQNFKSCHFCEFIKYLISLNIVLWHCANFIVVKGQTLNWYSSHLVTPPSNIPSISYVRTSYLLIFIQNLFKCGKVFGASEILLSSEGGKNMWKFMHPFFVYSRPASISNSMLLLSPRPQTRLGSMIESLARKARPITASFWFEFICYRLST